MLNDTKLSVYSVDLQSKLAEKVVFFKIDIKWLESLMWEGIFRTKGSKILSRKAEIFSVSPLHPLTIGLIPGGFL